MTKIEFRKRVELPTAGIRASEINFELDALRGDSVSRLEAHIGDAFEGPVYLDTKYRFVPRRLLNIMGGFLKIVATAEAESEIPARIAAKLVAQQIVHVADEGKLPLLDKECASLARAGVKHWQQDRVAAAQKESVPSQTVIEPATHNSLVEQMTQTFAVEEVGKQLRHYLPNFGDRIEEVGQKLTEGELAITYLRKFEGYLHAYLTAFWKVNHPDEVKVAIAEVANAQTRRAPAKSLFARRAR